MTNPPPSHDTEFYNDEQWDPFEDDIASQPQTQLQDVDKLGFCQLSDWEEERSYNKDPPQYIHYSIEWRIRRIRVNNRELSTDTEQDLVLVPASYWRLSLNPKLEKVLLSKVLAKKRNIKSEDTKVVMEVTQKRPITKSFNETDIAWSVREKQLIQ